MRIIQQATDVSSQGCFLSAGGWRAVLQRWDCFVCVRETSVITVTAGRRRDRRWPAGERNLFSLLSAAHLVFYLLAHVWWGCADTTSIMCISLCLRGKWGVKGATFKRKLDSLEGLFSTMLSTRQSSLLRSTLVAFSIVWLLFYCLVELSGCLFDFIFFQRSNKHNFVVQQRARLCWKVETSLWAERSQGRFLLVG